MTGIEWTSGTWNPVAGCSRVSSGCLHCYAIRDAHRLAGNPNDTIRRTYAGLTTRHGNGQLDWTGVVRLVPERLAAPFRWRDPMRVFVNSLSDLFHEGLADADIARVFAVMALTPRHTFQVLTKRPERMALLLSDPGFPFLVAKACDRILVAQEMARTPTEIRPLARYPGYTISNEGVVFSNQGTGACVFCGKLRVGIASGRYCSRKCKQNANYYRRTGREKVLDSPPSPLAPDSGEQGHQRVTLYRDGARVRVLLHHIVLETFDRPRAPGEQGCHRDGDPSNNHIANLRWGTQAANWEDRLRQGQFRSHAKLDDDQVAEIRRQLQAGKTAHALAKEYPVSAGCIRSIGLGETWAVTPSIEWPLSNCWLGTSVEDQVAADTRIPHLLATPAAVRFLSCEPLLGPLNLHPYLPHAFNREPHCPWCEECIPDLSRSDWWKGKTAERHGPFVGWVIIGGESGPGARGLHADWVNDLIGQCVEADVAVFVKQTGSVWAREHGYQDRKGGTPAEWPVGWQVRAFPEVSV